MLEILFYVSWTVSSWKKCMISVFVINYACIYTLTKTKYKIISLMIYCFLFFLLTLFRYLFFECFEHQRGKKEVANFEMLKKRTNKQTNKNIKHIHDVPPPPRFTLSKKEYVTIRLKLEISNPFRIGFVTFSLNFLKIKEERGRLQTFKC